MQRFRGDVSLTIAAPSQQANGKFEGHQLESKSASATPSMCILSVRVLVNPAIMRESD